MICGKSYSFRIRLPEEYAFAKTFESVFDEDTFFNSCLLNMLLSCFREKMPAEEGSGFIDPSSFYYYQSVLNFKTFLWRVVYRAPLEDW